MAVVVRHKLTPRSIAALYELVQMAELRPIAHTPAFARLKLCVETGAAADAKSSPYLVDQVRCAAVLLCA